MINKKVILLFSTLFTICVGACNGTKQKTASTFRMVRPWDKAGFKYHYNSGTNVGPLALFASEGLLSYVRTTDEIFYQLADSIVHNDDHTSLIHVREGVKWHDGTDFTANDVLAYYSVIYSTVSNYLSCFPERVDDYTIKMTWKTWMEPTDDVKTLMLAQDKSGTVEYSIFKDCINGAQRILKTQKKCEEGYLGWAPYSCINSAEADTAYNENFKHFQAINPDTYCGTGPYKLYNATQTEMILVKNEDYYLKDKIPYEKILVYNLSDLSNIYNKLLTGDIDYQDGFAPNVTLENIIEKNKTMVHLKAYDPAGVGLLFNLEKSVWTDNVREAFQYIFNREEVKNVANRYAITSYYPITGMVDSEAKKFLTEEDFNNLPRFSYDLVKAEYLLNNAGWRKQGNNWYFPDGSEAKLVLGYDGSNAIMSSLAEGVQSALQKVGIKVDLKRSADWGTWLSNARAIDSDYDMTVNWSDLSQSIAHPKACYDFFFNDQNGPIFHLPKITNEDIASGEIPGYEVGNVKLTFDKVHGTGKVRVYQLLSKLYSLSGEELKDACADLVYGVASLNLGVQMFRNVSGGFYNSAVIGNLPLSNLWKNGNRNVTFVPEVGTKEAYDVARCSIEFGYEAALLYQYTDAALE